jgi:hypothetical protein
MQAETQQLIIELRTLVQGNQSIADFYAEEAAALKDKNEREIAQKIVQVASTINKGTLAFLARWEKEHQ